MTAITLKQLRAFIAVARTSRFRSAAEEIGLTQSAVSILIKELESQLGTMLFDRHTRLVGLTAAGRRLLPLAEEIMSRVDHAVDLMEDLSKLRTGHVTIASAVVLAATYLPGKIASFQKLHPGIRVNVVDVPENEIREMLMNRRADIGIGSSRFLEAEINEHELFTDNLALFCHPDDPIAQRTNLRWRDLKGQNFVTLNPENPLQRKIDEIFNSRGISINRVYSVQFSTTLLALVEQGLGLGVLPENSRGLSGTSNVTMLSVGAAVEGRKVVALTLREVALSPAASVFFAHLSGKPE